MKVGDYVRTKWGIAKLTDITTYPCNPFKDEIEEGDATLTVYYIDTCFIPIDETRIWKEDIIKSRPKIIDLIEFGDVITYKTDIGTIRVQDVHNSVVMAMIKSGEIEVLSIVTKEQFSQMEYKVGETNE